MGTVTIWEKDPNLSLSGNMFCTILCSHRVWNPNPSPNLNPIPAVEISHHWKDPFTQYICICVCPKLQHYVGFCNVPSCALRLVARRVTLVAAFTFWAHNIILGRGRDTCLTFHEFKARSHGAAAAAIFLLQQMGCIGFNVSVHTAAAAAMVPQVNGFRTHFVRLWLRKRHHEESPDSGTLKPLNFSNFWTF